MIVNGFSRHICMQGNFLKCHAEGAFFTDEFSRDAKDIMM